jgi:hypothetical protein
MRIPAQPADTQSWSRSRCAQRSAATRTPPCCSISAVNDATHRTAGLCTALDGARDIKRGSGASAPRAARPLYPIPYTLSPVPYTDASTARL